MALLIKASGVQIEVGVPQGSAQLEFLQKVVGVYIEITSVASVSGAEKRGFEGLICNEDGKLMRLPVNEAATKFAGYISDVLVGDVLFFKEGEVQLDKLEHLEEERTEFFQGKKDPHAGKIEITVQKSREGTGEVMPEQKPKSVDLELSSMTVKVRVDNSSVNWTTFTERLQKDIPGLIKLGKMTNGYLPVVICCTATTNVSEIKMKIWNAAKIQGILAPGN